MVDRGPTTKRRSRRSRRSKRTTLQVVALVVGILLVLWGADTLARFGAESLLARNVQDATGVTQRPEVHVRGILFLPQVIRGAYNEVDVTTVGITSGPLRLERVDSTLSDVRVAFHDVLVRDVRRVGIGKSEERVTLTYSDLNAYFETTGRTLRLAAADDAETTITGSLNVLGRPLHATANVSLSVDNGAVKITPREIKTDSGALDKASRLLLGQRLTLTVPMGTLPFGHQLTSAEPYHDGIRVQAEGTGIVLRP